MTHLYRAGRLPGSQLCLDLAFFKAKIKTIGGGFETLGQFLQGLRRKRNRSHLGLLDLESLGLSRGFN